MTGPSTPPAGGISVVLADDHAPTREDIRRALDADRRFRVVGEAADAAGAIELSLRERPDLCLLDLNMPGGGLAATWEIAARLPDTRVVILTVSDEDSDLFAALRAGAVSYLLKDIDPRRLPHALHDVHAGKAAIPRELVARLVTRFHGADGRRRRVDADLGSGERLTSREWQVLELLAEGLNTREIARRLVLSPSAVRVHISAVVRKLGVPDRSAAVELFRGRGERSDT